MKRVIKPTGQFNIEIEEVPVPEPGPGEVRMQGGAQPDQPRIGDRRTLYA